MVKRIALIFIILAFAPPSSGNDIRRFERASFLYSACKDVLREFDGEPHDAESMGRFCLGFFAGVLETRTYEMEKHHRSFVCWPEGIDIGQMIRVYVKYMDDHQERIHHYQIITVIDAAQDAFECK
jgi:hypothetical protein